MSFSSRQQVSPQPRPVICFYTQQHITDDAAPVKVTISALATPTKTRPPTAAVALMRC